MAIDADHQSVTATAFKVFESKAVYREGCGCTLMAGTTEAALLEQTFFKSDANDTPPPHSTALPWPDGSGGAVDSAVLGVDPDKLKQALDDAFAEPGDDFAAGRSLGSAPEEAWSYSSSTANIIARIVRHEAQRQYENYYSFIREALFDRIGMTSAVMEADPSGTFVGSSYAFATIRHWAWFGLFYLQDGMWNGERVLPDGWVTYTTTPTPKAPGASMVRCSGSTPVLPAIGCGPMRRRTPMRHRASRNKRSS